MKRNVCASFFFALCIWRFSTTNLFADKGQLWHVPVDISEPSQKAHNELNGILILGTEEIAPVEVRFSGQVGLLDVTVVQIRDLAGFSDWVRSYFNRRGIELAAALDTAYANAADYINRGFDYFVFDYVPLTSQFQAIKPLVYRFESSRLYYPFKTSNIAGKEGTVDLILLLPGSWGLLIDRSDTTPIYGISNVWPNWDLSSSAKVYQKELTAILPLAECFFSGKKIYLQVLKYSGAYDFRNDLLLD
jgi:hypothetical protein